MTSPRRESLSETCGLALAPDHLAGSGSVDRELSQGLLTVEQVAVELGVPASWIRRRVASRTVTCTRLGRHVRFTRAQVQAIVAVAEQPALAPPATGLTRRSRRTG